MKKKGLKIKNPPGQEPSEESPVYSEKSSSFSIVAIGASAGGLEAFSQLLDNLPPDTGMAFIFIQHLAPTHHSILSELLTRDTKMPVYEIKDGMEVKPDSVYVIPPGFNLSILDGKLQLVSRDNKTLNMPVDYFFRSLADEYKSKAIGVVLSGTASDGTLGLRAIKAEGGLTFAQDENSAKFDGMPRNAIKAGVVDFVLSPEEIAGELVNIARHPYMVHSQSYKDHNFMPVYEKHLSQIFRMLRNSTGIDFINYKPTTINRRLARRLLLNKMDSIDDYIELLRESPSELTCLSEDLLINVTAFFREPEIFQALKERIFPLLLSRERSPDCPFRIWIPGCSTGEEAYSIAITLLEYLKEKNDNIDIHIFATDISEVSIEKARAGIYPESISLDISPERLRQFFVKVEGGYQINKTIRNMCVFARQDIIKDPPFSNLDLISCRNVLIYLGPVLQKKVIPTFHYALNSTGILLLGSSETIGSFADLFSLEDKKYKFYSKKTSLPRRALTCDFNMESFNIKHIEEPPKGTNEVLKEFDIRKEADKIVLKDYSPCGFLLNDELDILEFRRDTAFYLKPSSGPATLNLMKMVREDLMVEVRIAIHNAKKDNSPVSKKGLKIKYNGSTRTLNLDVVPLRNPERPVEYFFLVLFTEVGSDKEGDKEKKRKKPKTGDGEKEFKIKELQEDLITTKEYLQSIIEEREATNEELRSALEEIQSSNEELQSTNEELETAKEELQSTNEELTTVNEELHNRNQELTQVNNDLLNLLNSVHIPIVMLGQDLRIRRFTPRAEKIFNLISADIGRPLSDLSINVLIPTLEEKILTVLDTLNTLEYEVKDRNGQISSIRIRPYKTIDNKIDGVVIAIMEVE